MTINKILLGVSLAILSSQAMAETAHDHDHHHKGDDKPWSVHIDTRTYMTEIIDADDTSEEISDVFTHSHISGRYEFQNKISLNGSVILEGDPAGHAHGGEASRTGDHLFDDHPLFIEELTLNYDDDHYGLYAGKFRPTVGRDPHDTYGWWGLFVFEDFQIREKLGAGGYAKAHIDEVGYQKVELSSFFADTSFLQESLLNDRDEIDKDQGGISNTEDFSSFAGQLSGELGNDHLNYYIGYAHQGNDTGDDENRFSIGLDTHYDIRKNMTFSGMVDLSDISHLGGESDHDRRYSTIGLQLEIDQFVMGGSFTDIHNDATEADEAQDGHITQYSVGYNFMNGFGADLGYQGSDEEGEEKDRIGLQLRYHADF